METTRMGYLDLGFKLEGSCCFFTTAFYYRNFGGTEGQGD